MFHPSNPSCHATICHNAWPEVWVPLRADSHERKRRAAGSAAPVFCYCVLRGTEPSEKCVYIRFLELGTAVPQDLGTLDR